MASWTTDLSDSIKEAVRNNEKTRIAVHTEAQVKLGRAAFQRLKKADQSDDLCVFEVIPSREWDMIPVGTTLV